MADIVGRILDRAGAIYNVRHPDFGAVGNGSTDDRAAIQGAIDAASADGGGVVYFTAGTYLINNALTLKRGVWLVGAAREHTALKAGGAFIMASGLASFNEYNAGIAHLTFDGGGVATGCLRLNRTLSLYLLHSIFTAAAGPAVWLEDCQYCTFESCRFTNSQIGLKMSQPSAGERPNGNVFHACRFEGNSNRGFEAIGLDGTVGIELLSLESCTFVNNGTVGNSTRSSIWLQRVRGATISRCWFEKSRGGSGVVLNTVVNPKVIGNFFVEETPNLSIANIHVQGNSFLPVITDNYFGSSVTNFLTIDSTVQSAYFLRNFPSTVGTFTDNSAHAAASGDTTPSVIGAEWLVLQNNVTTAITNLDEGVNGQRVTLFFTNGNTTIRDAAGGGSFQLAASVNFTGTADDTLTVMKRGNIWYEVGRSVN